MKLPDTNLTWLRDRIIYLTRAGSHAYGTSTPTSDQDVRGIAIPPLPYFFGFVERFEQAQFTEPDLVIHDLRKFVKLAADANPSVLELLWTVPEDQLLVHPLAQLLIDNRELFLSQKVAWTFSGYAISQLKKLQRSLVRPPERVNPVRADLIERFGYDTKDAMHVVRLLRMGKEILRGEGVKVRRPDAQELIGIRNGDWPLEDLVGWAQAAEQDLQVLLLTTKLPKYPDRVAIDALCTRLVTASFDLQVRVPVMASGFEDQLWRFSAGDLIAKKLSATED